MSGVYLTRRDPSRNLARFYRMLIVPTLFGEWVLLREWPHRQRRDGARRSSSERGSRVAGNAGFTPLEGQTRLQTCA